MSAISELVLGHRPLFNENQAVYFPGAPTLTVNVLPFTGRIDLGWFAGLRSKETKDRLEEVILLTLGQELLKKPLKVLQELIAVGASGEHYFILPQSLPTRNQLVEWASFGLKDRSGLSPNDNEAALDGLLVGYKDRSSSLNHVSIIEHLRFLF